MKVVKRGGGLAGDYFISWWIGCVGQFAVLRDGFLAPPPERFGAQEASGGS